MTALYRFQAAETPLLVNVPHAGIHVPGEIRETLRDQALDLEDTDWFVDRLYGFAPELGAGLLCATHSRYAVDLNRPPDDSALYSSGGTGLVPVTTFSGQPLYRAGQEPDSAEQERRLHRYWEPYHEVLKGELDRIRDRFGWAILVDGHSILSQVPALFPGRLPDLNLGTNRGESAAGRLVASSMALFRKSKKFSSVLDGRFKGGYITRHYGKPSTGIHALQLEMAQSVYMHESSRRWDEFRSNSPRELLRDWMECLLNWRPD